jgi:hypothetical protein
VSVQGVGKSLRVPARNRLVDDLLLEAVQLLAEAGHTAVQVVNVGCGMVSRLLLNCHHTVMIILC